MVVVAEIVVMVAMKKRMKTTIMIMVALVIMVRMVITLRVGDGGEVRVVV